MRYYKLYYILKVILLLWLVEPLGECVQSQHRNICCFRSLLMASAFEEFSKSLIIAVWTKCMMSLVHQITVNSSSIFWLIMLRSLESNVPNKVFEMLPTKLNAPRLFLTCSDLSTWMVFSCILVSFYLTIVISDAIIQFLWHSLSKFCNDLLASFVDCKVYLASMRITIFRVLW